MTTIQFISVVGLLLLGAVGIGVLLWRSTHAIAQDYAPVLQRCVELEQALSAKFTQANADMAARVEQVKGDLRTDLSDRLQLGLRGVQEAVDGQLTQGREEQGARLSQTVTALEQKFDSLKSGTEDKIDSLIQSQGSALKESRTELTNALSDLTKTLQEKFDKMGDARSTEAKEARGELSKTLTETTSQLQVKFEALEGKTSQNLEAIRTKVDERLQAISEQVQQKLDKNITEGFAHFQKVQEHLKAAEEQLRNVGNVGQSINELNSLLKMPHLRGKFGEAELGLLLADFLPAAAYNEQVAVVPGSQELVDAVVLFPNAKLPIDSKFNREQILPLFETSDPQQLKEARANLAVVIKAQAADISKKYIHREHGTTDLALMFVPSETIYFEIIRDIELCEALHKLSVFPVSPNTLAITLKSIAMSFGYYEFAKNVEKTLDQIKAAQKSFAFFQKKFEDVGKGLEKAQAAYSTASGHLNRYSNRVVQLTGEPVPEVEDGGDKPNQLASGAANNDLKG